ncbi:MAG: hypothetical protein ACR2QE_03510, partial [Acidimicrobiales bacterium]
GAQMIAAPLTLLYVALTQALTAEGSRARPTNPGAIERFGWLILLAMVAAGVAALAIVALFDSSLAQLLGDSSTVSEPVLVAMVAFTIASAPGLAASGVLRSRDQAQQALYARLWSSAPFVAAVTIGAVVDGARGVAVWGTAAQVLTIPIWWRAVAKTRPTADDAAPPR